ncbi:MAG: glycoside hydrolase family 127 protein [Planctomycetota bacterium]
MKSRPVDLKNVVIDDAFWAPRIKTAREVTIAYQWQALNDRVAGVPASGAVWNFRVAAGRAKGAFRGCVFQDSDLAKWLEAVAYSLACHPDKKLERIADGMIDLIVAAQDADGYLDTAFTIKDRDKRWTNLCSWHELYVMGHLMEAAVAYHHATGKRTFLEAMARAADHVAGVFGRGRGKRRGYPGHEEIELALVKLYRATGRKEYLELSRYFIDERGRKPNYFQRELKAAGLPVNPGWGEPWQYNQAHRPVRQQSDAVGHAVRAVYLYSAMADVAYETHDRALAAACKRLWKSATRRRMYVTGAIGSSASAGEAFTDDYELPNETAYTETCAAIGLVFWARRMLALDADGDYADVMERALYNAVLSGVSLDGRRFFYSNPLVAYPGSGIDGARATRRFGWAPCACCPPNVLRMLTSLGGYIYSQSDREAFVHLYVAGRADLQLAGKSVRLEQRTEYPWKEKVRVRISPESPSTFTLSLRIPGWCERAGLRINGAALEPGPITTKGYARIRRRWRRGDSVELTLAMPVRRVYPHPRIRQAAGCAAIQRGPVVYCLEEADNGPALAAIALPERAELRVTKNSKLLGGVPVIIARAKRAETKGFKDALYRAAAAKLKPASIKAIPYFMWANRKEGEMRVWIRSLRA